MNTPIRKNRLQWIAARVLLTALLFSPYSHAAIDNSDPERLIRSASQDILHIIRSDTSGDNRKIREQVEARVIPLADVNRMTAFAVGPAWRTATPEQKTVLAREFRLLLARTYLSTLTAYKKSADPSVEKPRYDKTGNSAVVRVEVSTKNNNNAIPVDFSLEKTAQGWKVYDITIEGISFMMNHRSQFAPIISSEGLDGLIKQLVERNHNGSTNSTTNK